MGTHAHVDKTTTEKLEQALNDAWQAPGATSVAHHWLGGRDWIIVSTHNDHVLAGTGNVYWGSTGGWPGNVTIGGGGGSGTTYYAYPTTPLDQLGLEAEAYGPDMRYFEKEGGAAETADTAGLVQDKRKTWIMYLGHDGRPTHLWLKRNADGGVIGQSVIGVGPAK